MREILDVIIEEKFDMDKKRLVFSQDGEIVDKIRITIMPGQIYEDCFVIHGPEDAYVYGYISTDDFRMRCMSDRFAGTEEVHFQFQGEHLELDEVCRGSFLIRSNQGEYVLPYEVNVQREVVESSDGVIKNMIHFGNLAKVDWQEALKIFYSAEFEEMIREKEPQLYQCYRALSAIKRSEHNMDQFLIAAGKKQRMGYFVEDSFLSIRDPEDIAEITMGIVRNGWGYTRLDVEAEGDFVFVEKEIITDDDFLGNRYKLSVYIDSDRLHAGKNFGRVILKDEDIFVEVPVEVYKSAPSLPGREFRFEKGKLRWELFKIFQSFRLKEINTSGWLKQTDQLVQKMMGMDDADAEARLYFAQILITAERYSEAGWILEHFGEVSKSYDPELEAYYLYLTSLLRKDETYTKQVAGEIAKIYKEQGESWRAAWLLLYVSKEYERNAADKWRFLEDQFENGCRSPIIYFEAVQMLNRNPSVLRKLGRFELQVLNYGNKKGVLSPDLLEQVYYLAGRVKDFSEVLYRILVRCYEKTQDERIVKEICTLLIKGNRVEKKYYKWFKLGIEAGVRITNLYEYYMMSLDLEKEEEIPKIVLLYFTYQNNLDHAHSAYLYQYVAEKREEYPDIYESYVHRIEGFVKDQIQRARMSIHLDKLYHKYLTEDMLNPANASAMINILFSYRMQVPNSLVRTVYVYEKDYQKPRVYPVTDKYMWLPVFAKDSCVVWEEECGNRFTTGFPMGINHDLANHPLVNNGALYVEDNPYLDLYLYGNREIVYEADNELLGRFWRLWKDDQVSLEIRREAAVRIMKYYYHTDDTSSLADYLESLPTELLSRREAAEAIKYMVYCRMDEMAYEWMCLYSPVLVDSKISASLLAAIIRRREYQKDERLLAIAYSIFEKGKYTNEILRYLVMNYEGPVYDQYQVWKAALACGVEIRDLSERLLVQMLFTGSFVEEHGEVFKKYLKDNPDMQIVWAYVIRRSYAFYLEGYSLESAVAECILQAAEEVDVPIICSLACLKYYAAVDILPDPEKEEVLFRLLKKMIQSGVHLPWFMQYHKSDVDFDSLLDKTILEYHARGEGVVKFRYLPIGKDFEDLTWKVVTMYPVCRRVFFTEHILFFGESMQYEVIEETDSESLVVKNGVLKMKDLQENDRGSRFGMINTLLEAKALERDKEFENLLEDYMKKDYINEHLFKLI